MLDSERLLTDTMEQSIAKGPISWRPIRDKSIQYTTDVSLRTEVAVTAIPSGHRLCATHEKGTRRKNVFRITAGSRLRGSRRDGPIGFACQAS